MVTCSADDIAKVAVAWDTEKNLKFDLPFMDIKPSIYFGEFQKKGTIHIIYWNMLSRSIF